MWIWLITNWLRANNQQQIILHAKIGKKFGIKLVSFKTSFKRKIIGQAHARLINFQILFSPKRNVLWRNFVLYFRLIFTRRIKYPVDYSILRVTEVACFKHTWQISYKSDKFIVYLWFIFSRRISFTSFIHTQTPDCPIFIYKCELL